MYHIAKILSIARPTHTCRLWFGVLRHVLPPHRVDMPLEVAEAVLATRHPDGATSCIRSHEVDASPACDLMVVVPAYNAGDRLKVCVESVLGQHTRYGLRMVVVDDGSTDGAVARLRDECTDSRLTVISLNENRGVSAARNMALRHIDARYVTFVDSDDELPQGAVEAWLAAADAADADVVEGSMAEADGGRVKMLVRHADGEPTERLTGFACGKVFASRLFAEVGFPEGTRYEDTLLSFVLYRLARRTTTVAQTTYIYNRHQGSFTSKEMGNYASIDAYWVVRRLLQDIDKLGIRRDDALYDALLMGMKLSGNRMDSLDEETSTAYFAAMCGLAENYFASQRPGKSLKYIDKAIRERNHTLYILASCLL